MKKRISILLAAVIALPLLLSEKSYAAPRGYRGHALVRSGHYPVARTYRVVSPRVYYRPAYYGPYYRPPVVYYSPYYYDPYYYAPGVNWNLGVSIGW